MLSGARVTTLNSSGARLAMPRVSFALLPQAATTKAAPTRIGTEIRRPDTSITSRFDGLCGNLAPGKQGFHEQQYHARSEARRVGKECGSTCRSRWSHDHSKKK